MITMDDFFKGRDRAYAISCTPSIRSRSEVTVLRANALLAKFYYCGMVEAVRTVNSGWRPPAVNDNTKGAAPHSKHLTGEAVDLSDDDEALDSWCMTPQGQKALEDIGLWLESPESTPRWCHVQIVPPASGRRVFLP